MKSVVNTLMAWYTKNWLGTGM